MDRSPIDTIKFQHDLRKIIPARDRVDYSKYSIDLCPFHPDTHRSFFVYPLGYRCASCQAKGDLFTWLEKHNNWNFSFAMQHHAELPNHPVSESVEPVGTVKEFPAIQALEYHFSLTPNSVQYYLSKGFYKSTILRFKMGYGPTPYHDDDSRFTLPLFDDGKLFGIKFRRNDCCPRCWHTNTTIKDDIGECLKCHRKWEVKGEKYTSLTGQKVFLWGYSDIPEGYDDLVFITEGEWDRITLWQHGYHAVTSTGGAMTFPKRFATKLARFKRKVILFDNDEAGNNAAKMIQEKYMPEAKIFTDWGECKDITEVASKGGDIKEWLNKIDLG